MVLQFTLKLVRSYLIALIAYRLYERLLAYRESQRKAKIQKIKKDDVPDVVIVGAGFSGICMAIKLQQAGIKYVILEKNSRIGGTWLLNNYPGCCCDVPAALYSFSFELNPNWSQPYAPQGEILAYLEKVVEKYKLNIKFEHEVLDCNFNDESQCWNLKVKKTASSSEEEVTMKPRICIAAGGPLHYPKIPDIPGAKDVFQGETIHPGAWGKGVVTEGKNVVCIGSAASAVQVVPMVANGAKNVTVIQRTPNWIVPQASPFLPPRQGYRPWQLWCLRNIPLAMEIHRLLVYFQMEVAFVPFNLWGSPEKSAMAKSTQRFVSKVVTMFMEMQLGDSKKAEMLKPMVIPDYPVGCKRILRTEMYLPSLLRDNVQLKQDTVVKMDQKSVILSSGEAVPADVVIYATGFDVGSIGPLTLRVNDKLLLKGNQAMERGLPTLYGTAAKHLKNLFFVCGPQTGLGHNSVILMMETQCDYIVKIIEHMAETKSKVVSAKDQAVDEFQEYITKQMENRIWKDHCTSWYQAKDGSIPSLWPDSTLYFFYALRNPTKDYNFS